MFLHSLPWYRTKLTRQRYLSLLLAFALTLSAFTPFALAEDDGEREREVEPYQYPPIIKTVSHPEHLVLAFEDVAKAMRAGSSTLMSTAANREVLQYNRSQLADQQRTASSSINNLSSATNGLNQLRSGLNALGSSGSVSLTEQVLLSAMDAQLSMSQSQLSSQAASAATADKGYASGGNMSASIAQMDDAALQIIYGALGLYHGYWALGRQIERNEEELALLQRQLLVVTTLQELGKVTSQTVKAVSEGIAALEQGLKIARLEQQSLLSELNLLLGRPAGSTLELMPIPLPDIAAIQAVDYEAAWKIVYKESYTLKAKRFTQGGLQEQYDDVVKIFGEHGDRAWRAEQQLEGAKLETALAAEQLRTRFDKHVEKTKQSIVSYNLELDKLATAEATLQRAEQRYELGYLTEGELLQSRNDLSKQKATVAQAEDDLALNWQRWLLLQQGMDISAGESR